MKEQINLTDQQWDLLLALVSGHESNGGAEFYFACNNGGCGITYTGGKPVSGIYDQADLFQLRTERLVNIASPQRNVHRGKPTQKGIDTAHSHLVLAASQEPGPSVPTLTENQMTNSPPASVHRFPATAPRIMKEYEERLPLLASRALEQLRQRGAARDLMFSTIIESVTKQIHAATDALASIEGVPGHQTVPIAIPEATREHYLAIIQLAADSAADTVRDFGEGLLLSQGRLAVHADLLRDYTARAIREVRQKVASSDVFAAQPTVPWQADPIAENAIRVCEEIIDTRSVAENVEAPGRLNQSSDTPKAWSPLVLEWETRKKPGKQPLASPERIPQSELIDMIAKQIGSKREEITETQIERAALELCSHYESFQVSPMQTNDPKLSDYRTLCEAARSDSIFWKEREDEFQKHNTKENAFLSARLFSEDDWTFYIVGNQTSPSAEMLRSFKSLAREAAKGLRNRGGHRSRKDWLELLSCAEDEDTGKRHYKVIEGSSYYSEKALERDRAAGDEAEAPRNALIEYRLTSTGGLEKGRRWYTRSPRIENLFAKSAGQCLELRSLVPSPWIDKSEQKPENVTTVDTTGQNSNPTALIIQIRTSLDAGDRKAAVELRLRLDGCKAKELFMSAFSSLGGTVNTKRTAYYRWRESRDDAPSWADELMRARLLR